MRGDGEEKIGLCTQVQEVEVAIAELTQRSLPRPTDGHANRRARRDSSQDRR